MDRTSISISQTMTWCALPQPGPQGTLGTRLALPKTEPAGDELQSTALLSNDDDDESNTKKSCHSSFKLTLLP